MQTWIHPTWARPHAPTGHQKAVTAMHQIARASRTIDAALNVTPEERLLLAIFGLRPGETLPDAVHEMREAARTHRQDEVTSRR